MLSNSAPVTAGAVLFLGIKQPRHAPCAVRAAVAPDDDVLLAPAL
jgi:hypothetical protein